MEQPITSDTNSDKLNANSKKFSDLIKELLQVMLSPFLRLFKSIDAKVEGGISFFLKHYGKSKFMISMSKRVQVLGIEKLWNKSPKAFVYFFLFYLVRDTILYIIIPIYFAVWTGE